MSTNKCIEEAMAAAALLAVWLGLPLLPLLVERLS